MPTWLQVELCIWGGGGTGDEIRRYVSPSLYRLTA